MSTTCAFLSWGRSPPARLDSGPRFKEAPIWGAKPQEPPPPLTFVWTRRPWTSIYQDACGKHANNAWRENRVGNCRPSPSGLLYSKELPTQPASTSYRWRNSRIPGGAKTKCKQKEEVNSKITLSSIPHCWWCGIGLCVSRRSLKPIKVPELPAWNLLHKRDTRQSRTSGPLGQTGAALSAEEALGFRYRRSTLF